MALLRTKQLALQWIGTAPGETVVYTVPAEKRAVVKDVQLFAASSDTERMVHVRVDTSGGHAGYLFVGQAPTERVVEWRGDSVMNAGDKLTVYTQLQPISVYVSGAELDVQPT